MRHYVLPLNLLKILSFFSAICLTVCPSPILSFFLDGNQCLRGSRKRSRKRSEEEGSTWDSYNEVWLQTHAFVVNKSSLGKWKCDNWTHWVCVCVFCVYRKSLQEHLNWVWEKDRDPEPSSRRVLRPTHTPNLADRAANRSTACYW